MFRKLCLPILAVTAIVAFGLSGCGPTGPAPQGTAPKAVAPAAADALSEADQKAIEKQKTCPVSGEKLGSMGTPVKMTVKGRTVFLCCDGCKETFDKDPDKYLAKIDAAK